MAHLTLYGHILYSNRCTRVPPIMSEQQTVHSRKRQHREIESSSQPSNSERPFKRNRGGEKTSTGSYRNYYRRRLPEDNGEDLRLKLLKQEWICGKKVLDIGSNDGTFTLDVAKKFGPKLIVGVEMDAHLMKRARKNLRQRISEQRRKNPPNGNDNFVPLSCLVAEGKATEEEFLVESNEKQTVASNGDNGAECYPMNAEFRKEDIMSDDAKTSKEKGVYDVVLCLSVTKWIHMTGGDTALKRLFRVIHDCLKKDGIMILEPQPEQSYKRARRKGVKQAPGIKLMPDMFCNYLVKKGGFESYQTLRERGEKGTPFNRPVYILFKAKNTQDCKANTSTT